MSIIPTRQQTANSFIYTVRVTLRTVHEDQETIHGPPPPDYHIQLISQINVTSQPTCPHPVSATLFQSRREQHGRSNVFSHLARVHPPAAVCTFPGRLDPASGDGMRARQHAQTYIHTDMWKHKHPGILSINLLVYTNIMNHFNSFMHEHL